MTEKTKADLHFFNDKSGTFDAKTIQKALNDASQLSVSSSSLTKDFDRLTVGKVGVGKWIVDHDEVDVICKIVSINTKKKTLLLKIVSATDESGQNVDIGSADDSGFIKYDFLNEVEDDTYEGRPLKF